MDSKILSTSSVSVTTEQDRLERARWEGRVEGRLESFESWRSQINGHIREIKDEQNKLAVSVGQIKTKVGVWSAVGGVAGAGLVGVLIRLIPA